MPDNVAKVLCIFHAACADGLGAAWAVHRALGEGVEFVAARYGEPPKWWITNAPRGVVEGDISGRDILIVDFSYPLAVLRVMAQEARSVLVIDHHKTAQEDLGPICVDAVTSYSYKEFCTEWIDKTNINLTAIFDLERSGAGLAWDYLHPGTPRPRILDLIEDRDLRKFRFGDETRAFHAEMSSYDWTDLPRMFMRLDSWTTTKKLPDDVIIAGYSILRAQSAAVASAVAASRRTIRIAGHVVPCANVPPGMASNAGHQLCSEVAIHPVDAANFNKDEYRPNPAFSAIYYDGADGKRHFSLRSPEGGADVGRIAKRVAQELSNKTFTPFNKDWHKETFTGGGHEHSAGFDAPLGWNGE
jgi:hypothetical protein